MALPLLTYKYEVIKEWLSHSDGHVIITNEKVFFALHGSL